MHISPSESGTLFIVATPIGNLEDMTFRAVRVLESVDCVVAEDTRTSGTLLQHFDIHTPTLSYHDHNKESRTPELINDLLAGRSIAIISDAGTPGVSDPAFYLVREAIRNNIRVSPVPGPSAAISALVSSGLPTDRWVFEGFLPRKKGRHTRLNHLKGEERTLVLYESKHRLMRTLQDIRDYFGDRQVSVGREMTKQYEEFVRGSCSEVIDYYENHTVKGEFVLVIHGAGTQ